jgi:hypothetical protein
MMKSGTNLVHMNPSYYAPLDLIHKGHSTIDALEVALDWKQQSVARKSIFEARPPEKLNSS